MKVTVWLLTRDQTVWISAAETLVLATLIVRVPESLPARGVALVLLGHLAYRALTSLPMGRIPSKPVGARHERKNQDLRSRVVGFLNEVRNAQSYAERAHMSGLPREDIEANIRLGQRRVMAAAAEVARASGRAAAQTAGVRGMSQVEAA